MVARISRVELGMRLGIAEFRAKLKLSEDDHERLLDSVEVFQRAEALIGERFVKVTFFDGEKLVLEIPPHREQSAAIKTAFLTQIQKDFSPVVAEEIAAEFEANFEVFFYGLGKFARTFTVHEPDEGDRIRIVNTATIPEGVERAPASAIRQASDLSGNGSFDRDSLGIFHQAIASTIDTYFPKQSAAKQPPHVP